MDKLKKKINRLEYAVPVGCIRIFGKNEFAIAKTL